MIEVHPPLHVPIGMSERGAKGERKGQGGYSFMQS